MFVDREKLDALNEAGELIKYVDLEVLLSKLMELSVRIMNAQVGAIVLAEEGGFRTGIEWGLSEEILASLRTRSGEPFLRTILDRGEPVLIEDARASELIDTSGLPVHLTSIVAVPLTSQSTNIRTKIRTGYPRPGCLWNFAWDSRMGRNVPENRHPDRRLHTHRSARGGQVGPSSSLVSDVVGFWDFALELRNNQPTKSVSPDFWDGWPLGIECAGGGNVAQIPT